LKKYFAIFLSMILVMQIASCGKEEGNTQGGEINSGENQSEVTENRQESEENTEGSLANVTISIDGKTEGVVELVWSPVNEDGTPKRDERTAVGENGVVSSASVYASQAGLAVLKAGGNAVDAAIAVSYALGVVEPQSSGIGGGGFMLIHTADGEDTFIDFREIAPAAQTPYDWLNADGSVKNNGEANYLGGLAVAVPGTVAGMELALKEYGSGKLTRQQIMTPAIELANRGFYVGYFQNDQTVEYLKNIKKFPVISAYFLKEDQTPYEAGDVFSNPDLGKTLSLIAKDGADAFYKGEIAEAMLAEIHKYGGVMIQSDLDNYQAGERQPVTGTYHGYQIISSPPPSSGGTHIVQILNILENFNLGSMQVNSSKYLHLWSEAFKASYADRAAYMADTDFVSDVPLKGLTSKSYAKTIADKISGVSQNWIKGNPDDSVHNSTSSFSVADKYGNIVTVTQSNECSFGSCVAVPGYGFILNDEMHDFSTDPNSVNCVQGKKHPLSSMSPTVVLNPDGTPLMTLGSPGGYRIYTTVAQVISHVIDHDMDLQDAIDCARIYDNGNWNGIEYESGGEHAVSAETAAALSAMGHAVKDRGAWENDFGGVQGVMYMEDGTLYGAADPRRDGKALGY